MPGTAQPRVRLGDFELNLQSGELWSNGHRLRLPQQSFRILTILLKTPGEVVTREELRKELWPDNTFVDFDHGVNSAVRRLREALNDSAEEPKFIETLPRLGYRYLGPPVTTRPRNAEEERQTVVIDEPAELPRKSSPERLGNAPRYGHSPAFDAKPVKHGRRNLLVLFGACAALILLLTIILRRLPHEPRVTRVVQLTRDARIRSPIRQPVTDGLHLYF